MALRFISRSLGNSSWHFLAFYVQHVLMSTQFSGSRECISFLRSNICLIVSCVPVLVSINSGRMKVCICSRTS